METIVKKWGNSLACRIPVSIAKELGLTNECKVDVSVQDGKIVIAKALPEYSLEELVSRITPENKHDYAETDFGKPVGKELL